MQFCSLKIKRMRKITLISFLTVLSVLSVELYSQDVLTISEKPTPPVTVKPLLGAALELGGESVAKIAFTNGDTQDMPAGQGGSIFAGIETSFASVKNLRIRGTIGIKYLTTAADNAHIRLTRIPLNLSANWMLPENIRLGVGIVSHRAIHFRADGIGDDFDLKANAAPSFEIAWKAVGFSFIPMTYKAANGETFNATAFGLTFSGVLPGKK